PSPALYQVSITGPYNAKGPGETPSRRRILISRPSGPADEETCAKKVLSALLRRAYRGRATAAHLDRAMKFYRQGRQKASFDAGIELALRTILVNPRFLFRIEEEPAGLAPKTVYKVSDLDLASRLSFFLWSSIP